MLGFMPVCIHLHAPAWWTEKERCESEKLVRRVSEERTENGEREREKKRGILDWEAEERERGSRREN